MPPSPILIDAKFPPKLECLFQPKRFKVLWGGRGASRSWSCARALLLIGAQRPIRVLCARETQKSISESVHQLLKDQINSLGLTSVYTVQEKSIFAANGTQFTFEGIRNNTSKIKSYEGLDYCWVEEANKVSKRSWNDLIPTIRRKGSEIWMTFNPELEEDYTYKRFVKEEASTGEAFIIHMTFRDNPWFETECPDLHKQMLHDKQHDPDLYLNIWEGQCRQNLEGAIFANELRSIAAGGRICRVPYEPSVAVDTFWDIGKRDKTAIWFAQQVGMEFRVIDYFEDQFVGDVGYYVKELRSREYNYGTCYLPHDAKATRLGMRYSVQAQIGSLGMSTHIVDKQSIVDGVNAARLLLRQCYIDEAKCEDGLKCLRHYRYKVVDGQVSREPDHDSKEAGWASHGADAFRYMAVMRGSSRSGVTAATRVVGRIKDALNLSDNHTPRDVHLDWMGH